jgi:hypothetical protein
MSTRKGIAIQLETQLLKKLDNQDTPRNEIINKALETFFIEEEKNQSAFVQVEEDEQKEQQIPSETMTEDLYNEIYSTLYNTEIIPLKNQISLQRELIETLQYEIEEYKNDKTFLKHQIRLLFEQPPKKLSRFHRKKREQEIQRVQTQDQV